MKEKHYSQNFFISIIFGRSAISFGIWQRFLGSIVKTTFYTSKEKVRGEKFYWQTVFFFFGPRAKNSRPSGKTFQQGCRNSIIRVHRNILRSNVFSSFFYPSWTMSKQFSPFLDFFRPVCQSCILRVHRYKLSWILFFRRNWLFSTFSDFDQNNLACWQKFFGSFIKTAIYVSIGTLWGEILLFWNIRIFITFGHWANNFRFLVAKFSIRLWKLHSRGPENHFEKMFFFWKKFVVSFGPWAKQFWSSREILSANLSKLHYTRPQKN